MICLVCLGLSVLYDLDKKLPSLKKKSKPEGLGKKERRINDEKDAF